jgi:hypothetical protein
MHTLSFGNETAPPETLAALREIDPAADLVHLGGAEWMLGIRGPNPGAQERIARQLRLLEPMKHTSPELGREFQLLQFYAGGFRPIMLYRLGDLDPDGETITFGWIVDDFRIRDFNHRVRPAEAEAEFRAAISLDEGNKRRAQVFADYFDAEGGSLWRHVMAGARSFINRVRIPPHGD